MGMIIMAGLPCSGKTRRAQALLEYAREHLPPLPGGRPRELHLVNEESLGIDRRHAYTNATTEKLARGSVLSAAERLVSRDAVVIVDSLNYIKGFRYQLFCAAKNASAPHCVVWTIARAADCAAANAREGGRYEPGALAELAARFEEPDSQRRWDSPLHVVQYDAREPDCAAVFAGLQQNGASARPNLSAMSAPMAGGDAVAVLNEATAAVMRAAMEAQAASNTRAPEPLSGRTLDLRRPVTLPELRALKRQFLAMTRARHGASAAETAALFVEYINCNL